MAATAPAVHSPGVEPAGVRNRTSSAGAVLAFLLLAALTLAVFAHGATSYPAEARVQVGLAAAAIVASALWLFVPGRRIATPAGAWIGLGLMIAFAAWSGLSLSWTVSPSGTWVELNRAITYALVVALALTAGSWSERTVARVAWGYLAIALAAALYALGGKLAPGIHIGGLVHLDQTRNFSRLRAPVQYWNALALFCVMAVPIALRLAVEELRPRVVRLGGLAAMLVLLVTIGLTYSRGGVVALLLAVGLTIALAGDARLRTLMYLAIALAAAAAPLAVGFGTHDLTTNGLPVSKREGAGVVLALVLAGSLALAAATLVLCTVAISAALPSWAQTKSQNALADLSRNPSPAQLRHAEAQARLASRLDTLSAEPLLNAAAIARRRGHPLAARAYLLHAAGREPYNAAVWLSIAGLELQRGDLINVSTALDHVRNIDPRNTRAYVIASLRGQVVWPANDSATATGTPLISIVPGGTGLGTGAAPGTGGLIPAPPG